MAHKTFISYKYSESQDLRDRIIDALGEDATYYKGESPFKLEGETSTVGGGNIIAWIGDSHSELGLPGVVGNRLKSKLICRRRDSKE